VNHPRRATAHVGCLASAATLGSVAGVSRAAVSGWVNDYPGSGADRVHG
jgi:hypothetical protein